jgi:hypothetical protein
MRLNSTICEIQSKVQVECGARRNFWSVSIKNDYDETKPLRSESAMQECGLFHNAVVGLELENSFYDERDALFALREACMQHFTSLAWSQL